ncbi:MAG: tyrosine--tRNA ligase [Bacteroidota bacterium]|nr:tyrosine--tRNA ligase [Bacteroidota bacterium]
MNFVEELTWRGMIHNIMPGTEELLQKELTTAYVGIDPTADSLHIGHLVSVMMLKHFQVAGHKPLVLLGGATGMIGDPSGKSKERELLDEKTLRHNQECIGKQLARFIDFDTKSPIAAEMVNNYDWMKDFSFIDFIRDIGKHITVNYMMAKDSVKKRIGDESKEGMSFTEFTYQLVQGTDFLTLYKTKGCKLQMGGSDQWGNITTGTELIRRKARGEAFAITCPLITKADGVKFGKTEKGNVWLDPERTSPYNFYQFWLNVSDEDAERYIKIFTLLAKNEIDMLIEEHNEAKHLRLLQKKLAREVTLMVHSAEALEMAKEATKILFGKGTSETLASLDEATFLSVFEGVTVKSIAKTELDNGIGILDLLSDKTGFFKSKGELRRLIKGNGLSINKNKQNNAESIINSGQLINSKYMLVQKGKKEYFIIKAE